jgi:hypothetical protein
LGKHIKKRTVIRQFSFLYLHVDVNREVVGCVDGGGADEYVIIEYSYIFGDCDVVDGETCVVGKRLSKFVGGFGCVFVISYAILEEGGKICF